MIGVCCRYTQNRQTAEDLAHDAFLIAIDKVSSFENKGPFEAWLRRIVVNVALQYLREQKRQETWERSHIDSILGDQIQDEFNRSEEPGFTEAELLEVISQLPEHHRLVFNLYVLDNFTHAQIATRLGISEGTSKSHLARARKKIRELLTEQPAGNNKRKRAFFWLLFTLPVRNMDQLVAGKLQNLTISPRKSLALDTVYRHAPVPDFKFSTVSNAAYVKTALMALGTAVFLAAGSNMGDNSENEVTVSQNPASVVTTERLIHLDSGKHSAGRQTFSSPQPATISEKPVIVEKTIISEPMKNLSTLGGIVMASLALDTATLATTLSDAFKNRQNMISHMPEPASKPEITSSQAKARTDFQSGSFFASQLLWSGENNELYLMGDNVKVNVSKNKFNGSGKFSFLSKVYYVLVDGVPVKQNEPVKLQEKKYKLVSLNESEGVRKYGENGKSGVVEITLAD